MTVCPFCKKAVVITDDGPCPSCGKAGARPSGKAPPAASSGGGGGAPDWDDLEIQRGASGTSPSGPSSYTGGGIGGLGDDDDHGPGLSLELDTPVRSQPPSARSGTGASGQHPAYGSDPMPQPMPTRSQRPGGSDPGMAPPQQSSPNYLGPASSPQIAHQQPQQMSPQQMQQMAPAPPPQAASAATMIARYPSPPAQVWQTPAYAIRVLYRQFELRQDIDSLRKRRSPDLPLYEAALKAHDKTNFAIGLAITCAALTVATFIFFLPVILRFVRAD